MNEKESELEDSILGKYSNNLLGTLTVEEAKYVLKKGTGNFCDEVIDCAADVLIEEIRQLETEKQKLIEKLEEDIKKANEIINDQEFKYIEEVIDEQYERRKYAQEILKILKGENHGKYISNKQQINC